MFPFVEAINFVLEFSEKTGTQIGEILKSLLVGMMKEIDMNRSFALWATVHCQTLSPYPLIQ